MKQRTIRQAVSLRGKGVHTGEQATLTLKPAPEGHGIRFRRVDLYGSPEVRPTPEGVSPDLIRQTTLTTGDTSVHTPEHVLSALYGCGIDNVLIELDGRECPILDGSARPYVELIKQAEPAEQEAPREFFALGEPVSILQGRSSLIALPYDGLKFTCTSTDDRGIHTQHLSIEVTPDSYMTEIAPARTFTIYEEIEELLRLGKIQGGSLDCAIVIKGDKILSKEPLRFDDEFVRHKILDMIGDLNLLGVRLRAHIVAVRPGHALNNQLTRRLREAYEAARDSTPEPLALPAESGDGSGVAVQRRPTVARPKQVQATESSLPIRRILDILPHGYPFVLIDRVLEFASQDELTAIKNVTINEPYFVGHFPGNPVMPGVLQLEAMAQAAGVLMLRRVSAEGKVAFFMSADKVKFRQAVVPGDQIVINVKLTQTRGHKLARAEAVCQVDGKACSSAELLFAIYDAPQDGA